MISITPFFHVYHKYVFIMSNISKIKISGTSYSIKDENACKVVELTQAQYDELPTTAKTSNSLFVITDATAGDLSNYYTKSETDNAITAATSTKQDTLVSGTNIKTINGETLLGEGNITIQGGGGGGKAIEAGRGISITTGETADTVSFNLPISAGTGTGSLIIGNNDNNDYKSVASGKGAVVFPSRPYYGKNYATEESSFAHGSGCSAGTCSHAEGFNTNSNGFNSHSEGQNTEARCYNSHSEGEGTLAGKNYEVNACHAEGYHTSAMTSYSHAEGYYTKTTNDSEHSQGRYNVSSSASTTFGDSGNTLFSVGNGTSSSARHNAFEIRQNGDIYISKDGQDVKLQDQLGGGGGSITIDQSLDSGSTNPVANSAITETLGKYYYPRKFNNSIYQSPWGSKSSNGCVGFTLEFANILNPNDSVISGVWLSKINGKNLFYGEYSAPNADYFNLNLDETSAITASISSSSTDSQVPSAKAVYDIVGNIETLLSKI